MKTFMTKITRVVLRIFFGTICVFAVAAIALFIPVNIQHVWNVAIVNNDDMSPTIPKGSLVIGEKVTSESIEKGDVVILNSVNQSSTVIVSRVVDTTPTDKGDFFYQLKGDNNVLPDGLSYRVGDTSFVPLATVPVVGYVLNPINNLVGAILFVFTVILLCFVYVKFLFFHPETPEVETVNSDLVAEDSVDELDSIFAEKGLQITYRKTWAEKKAARVAKRANRKNLRKETKVDE